MCPRVSSSRRSRSAFTLIEILVASGIFLVTVLWALGTIFFHRGAADRTDRVDDYREMRIAFNRIARDLQDATRVRQPAYDYHTFKLRMSDARDQEVTYALQTEAGVELAAEPPATDETVYRLMRTVGTGADRKSEPIRQSASILWMKFTRLGERLVGLTVRMRPREKGKQGATYTATMSVSRVMM